MDLTKNVEDYLEVIYLLKKEKGEAKVKNISSRLKISLPSVTEMVKKLSKMKLINYKKYCSIELTKYGEEKAKKVYAKHKILTNFFIKLGVSEKIASHDACLAEHILSKETISKINKFLRDAKSW